jgi:hypothetical protein
MVHRPPRVALAVALTLAGFAAVPRAGGAALAPRRALTVSVLHVTPALVRQTIPPTFFGINCSALWDGAQGSAASARALAQTPIKTVRFPGGIPADWYDWQDPYYKGWSRTSPLDLWRYARSFGAIHVVFGTNYQGHLPKPPGKTYAVNSPQNAAAWVAFDKARGIPADMEVGNEEDQATLHKADDPAYASYIAAFNAQARAMHAVDPHVRVLGPVGTNEYYWWGLDGLGAFLAGAGNRTGSGQVAGLSLHFYRGKNWDDAKGVAQYWLAPQGPWAAIQAALRAHDTRRLPVYITEWNLGASDNHNAFTPTLGHALAVADVLGAFASAGVAGEDYFTVHYAHGWGLLYAGPNADKNWSEDRPVDSPTPTYYALALWGHMGNHLVALAQDDDAATVLSAYATSRDDGSIQVLLINKLPTAHTVRLALEGTTAKGRHLYVYSLRGVTNAVNDLDAVYDGVRMPSPQTRLPGPRDAGRIQADGVVATVPAYSATVLDLR